MSLCKLLLFYLFEQADLFFKQRIQADIMQIYYYILCNNVPDCIYESRNTVRE